MSSEEVVEENNALWRLFRNAGEFSGGVCRDVVEKHVLPRLNSNDVKFLYGVNTETRKLIKRSSRKGELKERFKVREMSSVSTLEFAWENKSLWPRSWDETWFCKQVAQTNKLELLKWAREEKKCNWDGWTIYRAAEQGNLEMIKYCVAKKCPIDEWACLLAAQNGHLEVLKYLCEEAKAPWDSDTAAGAALKGHLHILEYLVERKYDKYSVLACELAARNGHFDCLKYLHETAKAPWDSRAVRDAQKNNHPECVQYLLDNDCPLPFGWRYEDGELHTSESS
jgi:ankyrin repeat protein